MIQHIQPIAARDKRKPTIHGLWHEYTTYCGWQFQVRINGTDALMAVPTIKPITCLKCITQLRLHLAKRVKTLPVGTVERMLNDL